MRNYLTILSILFCLNANAASVTIYVAANGNDANNGTSTSTPWKTLAKVNSMMSTFAPGDNILFKRGDTWYGSLIVSQSGVSGNPITFGAYGTGAKPIITGFASITSWTSLGSNIWESTNAVSTLSYTNMVVVNGVNTPMGRTPNTGFYTYQSHSGNTTITSSNLTGTPNWTGAELAMLVNRYTLGRNPITAQSGGTLTYTATTLDGVNADNQNFIIQNDARTLDVQNEWFYNPSTKKLRIYSISSPVNVQVSTIDTLVYINSFDYITFDNISFQGSNKIGIEFINAKHITLSNCDLSYHGQNAIHNDYGGNSTAFTVANCTLSEINNSGIIASGDADAATVTNCTLNNVGIIFGAGNQTNIGGGYTAIMTIGANSLFRNNTIDSVGYIGIEFRGNNSIVDSNMISAVCQTLTDGGGVYTYNGSNVAFTGRVVKNNIVTNSPSGIGIYMDDFANGFSVQDNSVSNCDVGLFLHGVTNSTVTGNTLFDNSYAQLQMVEESGELLSNLSITNNTLIGKDISDDVLACFLMTAAMDGSLTMNNNYYTRPINENLTIAVEIRTPTYSYNHYDLSGWQSLFSKDSNTVKSPKTITDANDLRFEYNATNSPKVVALDANYIDVKNASYSGTITLAPYTSAVLIKNGNIPPVIDPIPSQTIRLYGNYQFFNK